MEVSCDRSFIEYSPTDIFSYKLCRVKHCALQIVYSQKYGTRIPGKYKTEIKLAKNLKDPA